MLPVPLLNTLSHLYQKSFTLSSIAQVLKFSESLEDHEDRKIAKEK